MVCVFSYSTWTGPTSITLKFTSPEENSSGDIKFSTFNEAFVGTVKLLLVEEGPVTVEDRCYVSFVSDDSLTNICIKGMAAISTDMPKSKTNQALILGTGELSKTIEGTNYQGVCYLDSKGTLKKDGSGEVTSISLSGKISGGTHDHFIFSGSFKATLTTQTEE